MLTEQTGPGAGFLPQGRVGDFLGRDSMIPEREADTTWIVFGPGPDGIYKPLVRMILDHFLDGSNSLVVTGRHL
jgi:hypothetical protein